MEVQCPVIIDDYNRDGMGGMDQSDQARGVYSLEKIVRCKFWPKKLFLGLFGLSVANGFILWKAYKLRSGYTKKALMSHEFYMNQVMGSLCGKIRMTHRRDVRGITATRLHCGLGHFQVWCPVPNPEKHRGYRCELCSLRGEDHRCKYWCEVCEVSLCCPSSNRACFREWHTLPVLPQPRRGWRTKKKRRLSLQQQPPV